MMNYLRVETSLKELQEQLGFAADNLMNAMVSMERAKSRSAKDRREAKAELTIAQANAAHYAKLFSEAFDNELVERVHANDGKTKSMLRRADIGTCLDPQMELHWTM